MAKFADESKNKLPRDWVWNALCLGNLWRPAAGFVMASVMGSLHALAVQGSGTRLALLTGSPAVRSEPPA